MVVQAAVVQFLAELGDRNWVVVLFLAAWCPFWGLRAAGQRWKETLLVAIGVGAALLVRSTLAVTLTGVGVDNYSWARNMGRALSPLVLWALAVKAYMDYRSADERARAVRKGEALATAPIIGGGDEEKVEYATGVFTLPPSQMPGESRVAQEQQVAAGISYGATGQAGHAEQAAESGSVAAVPPGRVSWGPMGCAVVVPFCTTLVVAFSDPLQQGRREGSALEPLVSVSGALLAAFLAVFLGNVLERSFSDRRFLLLATFALSLSALVATSSACLRFAFGVTPPATL